MLKTWLFAVPVAGTELLFPGGAAFVFAAVWAMLIFGAGAGSNTRRRPARGRRR